MPRIKLVFFLALLAAAAQRRAIDALIVDGLQVGFYNRRCPEAEGVVRDVVNSEVGMDRTIAAGLIRLFFHDCFITGCDASILLDESPAGDVPEKESSANGFTLHGLRTIDIAKSTLEAMCPRKVSCADILAFAARDAAVAAGLPGYDVAAGRRDGERSNMDDLPGNFPVPGHRVPRLTELFNQRGLSQEDLVVLSGAHSIGGAHCFMFSNRIYGFANGVEVDPGLDPEYAARLRQVCPPRTPNDDPERAPKVNFDARTGEKLDNAYYSELLAGRGLLTSDSALIEDPQTRATVELFAKDNALWQQKFAEAMQKVGALDVLVGEGRGEVRRQCRLVNRAQWPHHPAFPRRPFPRHPLANLINGFFHGFH
ncbi:peroxidase 5-like [Phragmites australis]|uniref:peroxidase 5-like n=1 Tax=Phragmites australis TaxID=29695 RepID=UPI002D7950CF|nr:peroxidase 5-like [Phragmites australis]